MPDHEASARTETATSDTSSSSNNYYRGEDTSMPIGSGFGDFDISSLSSSSGGDNSNGGDGPEVIYVIQEVQEILQEGVVFKFWGYLSISDLIERVRTQTGDRLFSSKTLVRLNLFVPCFKTPLNASSVLLTVEYRGALITYPATS